MCVYVHRSIFNCNWVESIFGLGFDPLESMFSDHIFNYDAICVVRMLPLILFLLSLFQIWSPLCSLGYPLNSHLITCQSLSWTFSHHALTCSAIEEPTTYMQNVKCSLETTPSHVTIASLTRLSIRWSGQGSYI